MQKRDCRFSFWWFPPGGLELSGRGTNMPCSGRGRGPSVIHMVVILKSETMGCVLKLTQDTESLRDEALGARM